MSKALPFRVTTTVFHVLFALSEGAIHAYGIMKSVEDRSDGRVRIAPGSLHFTRGRLLEAGLAEESEDRPDPTEDDARRKYYRLTARGRSVLADELAAMADIVDTARQRKLVRDSGAS